MNVLLHFSMLMIKLQVSLTSDDDSRECLTFSEISEHEFVTQDLINF
jgi:hypothetical protein